MDKFIFVCVCAWAVRHFPTIVLNAAQNKMILFLFVCTSEIRFYEHLNANFLLYLFRSLTPWMCLYFEYRWTRNKKTKKENSDWANETKIKHKYYGSLPKKRRREMVKMINWKIRVWCWIFYLIPNTVISFFFIWDIAIIL